MCPRKIIIPFSGGRDSTSLFATSLALFPNKKYKLVTVLNGMSEKQENVFNQINYITKLLPFSQKPNVETIFIDSSENMKKYVIDSAKKYGIKVASPFFDVIEEPYDSTLLLASLGIPLKNHKSEMKCLAGGLNPQKLDIQTQRVFTDLKNRQTIDIPKDKGLLVYYNPNEILKTRVDLSKDIQELKRNENFLQGAYKE